MTTKEVGSSKLKIQSLRLVQNASITPVFIRALSGNFRAVEDALKALKPIAERIQELVKLQQETQRQVTSAVTAGMFLQINLPGVKESPTIKNDETVKLKDRTGLKKNYAVIRELWETRQALEMMEAKIRTSFAGMAGPSPDRALNELARLKKSVNTGLEDAFVFIASLANSHIPSKLSNFVTPMHKIIEKSISYETASTFNYVFEDEGDLVFTHYVQMKKVTDDEGQYYPEFYITLSYKASGDTGLFVSIMPEFVPPSDRLLLRKVKDVKSAVRSLNLLLNLDQFANSLGSVPIEYLTRDRQITKDLFMYQNSIASIEVDEDQLVFHLKPYVGDPAIADKVIFQIYQDLQAITRSKNVKVRMKVVKDKKRYKVGFFFVNPRNAPLVAPSDLDFLKDRFNLDDKVVQDIAKTINTGGSA